MYGIIARPAPHRVRGARAPPTTSVVIPCRNEAGHIRRLVRAAARPRRRAASSSSSRATRTDDTEAVIRQAIADEPRAPPAAS